jgi:SOS regulatory protein LexA
MFNEHKNQIIAFYESQKRMPSYSEIMALTGLKSKSPVFKLVRRLIAAGIVEKDYKGKLIPKNLNQGVIRLGQSVSAGFGSPAEEELVDTLSLDEWLIKNKEATYILSVQGSSMIEVGILDGDNVLVERTSNFKDGQIVVALLNDGYTVKFLRKKGKDMWLEPANKDYQPIYPTEDNQIQLIAVVKTIIRQI